MDDKLHHDIVKMAVEQSAAGKCFCSKLWRYDEMYRQ